MLLRVGSVSILQGVFPLIRHPRGNQRQFAVVTYLGRQSGIMQHAFRNQQWLQDTFRLKT
jgi:hypothetical protein